MKQRSKPKRKELKRELHIGVLKEASLERVYHKLTYCVICLVVYSRVTQFMEALKKNGLWSESLNPSSHPSFEVLGIGAILWIFR